jgi:hypothetical protein
LSPSALGGTEWKRLPDGGFGCPARTWRAHSELRPVLRRPGEGGTPRSELRTQDAPQSALNGSNLIQPNPAKKNSAAAASAVTCHPTSLAAVVELRPLRLVVPKRRGGSSAKRWGGGTGSASRTCANLAGSGVRASVWTAASSAPLWSVHPLVVRRPVSDAVVLNAFLFRRHFRFQISSLSFIPGRGSLRPGADISRSPAFHSALRNPNSALKPSVWLHPRSFEFSILRKCGDAPAVRPVLCSAQPPVGINLLGFMGFFGIEPTPRNSWHRGCNRHRRTGWTVRRTTTKILILL